MSEHKFVSNDGAPNAYVVKIWCEYCGLIIYDGNWRDQRKYEGEHGVCPNHPHKQDSN